jgi:prophage maintenance system killer protein
VRYLTLSEALELHRRVIGQSGGALGVLNLGALESAPAQPRMAFGGGELYPSIVDKAAALGFSLIQNHPFLDGNKRTGHAAMEVFLLLMALRFRPHWMNRKELYCRWRPAKWIGKHLRFGFAIMSPQSAEGRRLICFRPLA